MLAPLRRFVASLVLLLFAASFVPWSGAGWVERIQMVPALLGTWSGLVGAGVVLVLLLVLTLLFGRVYCSWICPLGILQDVACRAAHPRPGKRKGKGVRFAPNHPWLRAFMALLAFGGLAVGSVGLLAWMDPYSIAARGMAAIVHPLLSWLGNALGAELPLPDGPRGGILLLAVVGGSLALPLGMALWRGRLYCNTFCPVGAVLGLLSRWARVVPRINADSCARCGACMKHCKAQAIDVKSQRVDASRCVGCYDCLTACRNGAISLRPRKATPVPAADDEPVDASRRAFLGLGVAGLAVASLPELPGLEASSNPAESGFDEAPAAVPPGAGSVERFLSHCTGCGLCMTHCPTQVLRPSLLAYGLMHVMKPTLDYSRAFCDPGCTACSHVCPTGALLPLSLAEKRRTQIGLVHYQQGRCRVWANRTACARCVTEASCPTGALEAQEVRVPSVNAEACRGCRRCARVCPAGAITMVELEGQEKEGRPKRLAVMNHSKCIGCGACAAACRPEAITLQNLTAPRLAHPEKCIGCGACEHVCPVKTRPQPLEVVPRAQHLETSEAR